MELQHVRKFMCGLIKCGYLLAMFVTYIIAFTESRNKNKTNLVNLE